MAFRLVIAEKPSVAQTIAAALGVKEKKDGYIEGGGYLISWCVGHLVQLAEAAAYGEQYKKWSFESLPILPEEWQYAVDPDKGKQFKTIKELMHRADVSEVVNACDAGREGELIFRFVYEVAGCKKPMRRLWISSMEDGAIKAGFASLKDGQEYDALFASALCRAKADWLIGINATRLFSCLYGKTLNVGRVQTPTLKMLTDRDAAISHFQKEKYYHVRLDLSGAEAASGRISDKKRKRRYAFPSPERRKPQPRRSSLTLPLCSGKRTAFSVTPQSRPLTLHNPFMKSGSLLIRGRTAAFLLTTWAAPQRALSRCFAKNSPLWRARTSRRRL